jgi:hypothetical protein
LLFGIYVFSVYFAIFKVHILVSDAIVFFLDNDHKGCIFGYIGGAFR